MERRRINPASSSPFSIVEEGLGLSLSGSGPVSDEERKKMRSLSIFTIIASFIALFGTLYVLIHILQGLMRNPVITSLSIAKRDIRSNQINNIEPMTATKTSPKLTVQDNPFIELTKAPEYVVALSSSNEEVVQNHVNEILEEIRTMKRDGVVIEEDEHAQRLVTRAQAHLRKLIAIRYGPGPYYVEMKLTFPKTMPDYIDAGPDGTIIIEMAPIKLVPYSVFYFLELAKNWKGGAFHRNAGHVLQAMAYKSGKIRGLAFQEYHPDYPHKVYTMGYAGRPGGPGFYISTQDNTENHGPGSQGSRTEADSCFGRIYKGEEVVQRMKKQPGATKPSGFIDDDKNLIGISLRIMNTTEISTLKL